MQGYFFDTYAIIESLMRNPAYTKYDDVPLVTTIMNKIEVYWWALTRYDQTLADILLRSLAYVSEISDEIIRDAMIFRRQNKRHRFSYADAVGYIFARRNNLIFLTGDRQFDGFPGVEFVK